METLERRISSSSSSSWLPSKKWAIDLVSGLAGGFLSVSVCAPLDIARTRLNMMHSQYSVKKYAGFIDALRTILREEGLRGYYKGYSATVVSVPLFHSLFFSTYNWMKQRMTDTLRGAPIVFQHIAASTLTGLICDTLTNPLWVVRTRLQVQYMHKNGNQYEQSVLKTMKKIVNEEGLGALYKGLGASLIGLTHVAVYFPIYEHLRGLIESSRGNQGQDIQSSDVFLASLLSKLVACMVTYPHVVIRTRLQDNRQDYTSISRGERIRIKKIVSDICQKEGIIGLYRGLKVDLVRVLPANAITFVVYETCQQHLTPKASRRQTAASH